MACAIQICEKVLELLEAKRESLPEVEGGWKAAVRFQFYEDSSELDQLEISIVPGSLSVESMTREGGKAQLAVGVALGKRLNDEEELPALADFAEAALFALQDFSAFRPEPKERFRGVELSSVSTESVFSNETLDSIRCYDSIIVLTFNIYFRKGG